MGFYMWLFLLAESIVVWVKYDTRQGINEVNCLIKLITLLESGY